MPFPQYKKERIIPFLPWPTIIVKDGWEFQGITESFWDEKKQGTMIDCCRDCHSQACVGMDTKTYQSFLYCPLCLIKFSKRYETPKEEKKDNGLNLKKEDVV